MSQFITSIKAYQVKKTTTYSLQCNGKFQPSFSLSQRAVFKEATCSELPSELLFQVEELHRIHETCIDQGFVCINDTLEKKKNKPISNPFSTYLYLKPVVHYIKFYLL